MSVIRYYVVEVDCPTFEIEVEAVDPDEAIELGREFLREEAGRVELTLRHGRITDRYGVPRVVEGDELAEDEATNAGEGVTS